MRRREFLAHAGLGVLAPALVPLHGWLDARPSAQRGNVPASAPLARLTAALEKQIPDWMQQAHVPGLSMVVIQNASIAWQRGFGVRDAATKAPVTSDVMFEAASMSKPVFAYVVMKLCESGVMSLDVPLTKYTPDRFLADDPRLDAITARHVLSHTSGFQNWRSEKTPLAIHFAPGAQYLYSGEGYNYLQTVVTRLLGEPFESYMRTTLFAPFDMSSSRYVWDDVAQRRMARPHTQDGTPIDNTKSTPADVARYGSAGALLTTPADFATFVINVIDPRPADAARLKQASVADMLRPHAKLPSSEYPSSWALGWQIFHDKAGDFIYHGGDNRGFHCSAVASATRQRGYVAMTNGDSGPAVLRNVNTLDAMQQFLTAV